MLRKLLTLIAICAGFAAVAEPARAAVTTVESVRLVERSIVPRAARIAARMPQLAAVPALNLQDKGKLCPKPTVVVIVPTVMLNVDRARE
ncbi:MAG: hypothetical protein ABIP41_06425 [Croceibacterium sp.]